MPEFVTRHRLVLTELLAEAEVLGPGDDVTFSVKPQPLRLSLSSCPACMVALHLAVPVGTECAASSAGPQLLAAWAGAQMPSSVQMTEPVRLA